MNIKLVPHTPEHLLSLLAGRQAYERSFGLRLAEGLCELLGAASPEYVARLKTANSPDVWTHGFAVIQVAEAVVIGLASFKGPPTAQGVVEIAYGIAPGYRGKGYATEAASALVQYAFSSGKVRLAIAHTLPVPNASTRVLTKAGFRHAGEVIDPEDGRVWQWGRRQETANSKLQAPEKPQLSSCQSPTPAR